MWGSQGALKPWLGWVPKQACLGVSCHSVTFLRREVADVGKLLLLLQKKKNPSGSILQYSGVGRDGTQHVRSRQRLFFTCNPDTPAEGMHDN